MTNTGKLYDKIADWWTEHHQNSTYGINQLEKALQFLTSGNKALDVGCGPGGRMIEFLEQREFEVFGIDISIEMLKIAQEKHPNTKFELADIIDWQTDLKFDFIMAWDSIFHLPLHQHSNIIQKLCSMLNPNGILFYTFGDEIGEHFSNWHEEKFYYSSIGINGNLETLIQSGCECKHLEIDQFPEKHVYLVAKKIKP